jgi:hypothetical protein
VNCMYYICNLFMCDLLFLQFSKAVELNLIRKGGFF